MQIKKKNKTRVGQRAQGKGKIQSKLPRHPDINYAHQYQLRYDVRIKLDSIMDEAESHPAIVDKFKELFVKIIDD